MKRNYTKPAIVFEDFSLSSNITASCAISANSTENSCGYVLGPDWGNLKLFLNDEACEIVYDKSQEGLYGDQICYDNPSELTNIFHSF